MKINGQEWFVDKKLFLDSSERPITQSLFLELGYTDFAVYTLKEDHFEYKGKLLPSLKRLYLEMADPTEYNFANTFLLNWKHWQRMYGNKQLTPYIDEWREELELKLRYRAHQEMLLLVEQDGGNYSAAKWLADRGWDKRSAGRPSKAEKDKELRIKERLDDEFKSDVDRLSNITPIGVYK